jgi:hypothetical protein
MSKLDIHDLYYESCLNATLESANVLVNDRDLSFADASAILNEMTKYALETAKTKKHLFDETGKYIG